MTSVTRKLLGTLTSLALLVLAVPTQAGKLSDETPTWPGDLSAAGLMAASSQAADPSIFEPFLPSDILARVREYVQETRAMGLDRRAGSFSVLLSCPLNVNANTNHAPDRIGESQSEVAVAVNGDTVVVGWNDSQGFLAGNTVSSYSYSTNGGATFTDGGNIPLALASDQAFGDPGIDTDERGNWYYNQIYTRAAGAPGPTAQQNIGVHHGRFNGVGQLIWDLPVMASIGTSATGNLDKCLLACDRVTGNVYTAYTRFTATPQIEIVRSTTLGVFWDPPVVLDATATPTSSKQGARPFCGPGGEVYVVWEKGANSIFCPDGAGNIASFNAQTAFTRSLNFGATYDPLAVIGTPVTDFLATGPGDLRERANEFPDIAVDRSGGAYNGNIYVTWHDGASWVANTLAGPVKTELVATNNNPGTPDLFVIGDDANGLISPAGDLDYWQFSATQGQNLIIDVLPQGFVCGVSGTTRGMRVRLFATMAVYTNPTGFPDSLLAASFIGAFENRIVWTAPKTGNYLIRLQISSGTTTGTYTMRVRPLTFTATPARDARDVVVVRSSNQGATWTGPQLINDDPAGLENRRPFNCVDGTGAVSVYWHDSRDPGLGNNAALTSVYGTTSRDGGITWTPNYCVSDELSFYSFNTIAIPNIGDYNQAAASGRVNHPAWTDQRLSTGDVRTPGTNTYTAGLGPEAYTTRASFDVALLCPPDTIGGAGTSVPRKFRITNTGTLADQYNYCISDVTGWLLGGPVCGTTPVLAPSSFFDVFVTVNLSTTCTPASDLLTLSLNAVGDPTHVRSCGSTVYCDIATPTLVERFNASPAADGVELAWSSDAITEIRGWNLYRSLSEDAGFQRINPDVIPMAGGGEFQFRDDWSVAGTVYYRLAAMMRDGSERVMQTLGISSAGSVRALEFRLAGRNPFQGRTTLTYALPAQAPVRIDVYTVSGRRVATLVDRIEGAGVHSVPFELRGTGGRSLGAGLYLLRLRAGSETRTLRAIALE